jgi:hypothetical protein
MTIDSPWQSCNTKRGESERRSTRMKFTESRVSIVIAVRLAV